MNGSMPVPGARRIRRKNAGGPRGRQAICWAVGLFALSQTVVALWISHDGFSARDPVRRERLRVLRQRMAEAASPPKVVALLGSSHVLFGLLPRQMSLDVTADLGRPVVVTNQGFTGGGPVRSLLAMDRLLREGVVPDLVVLETFPVLFDGRDETGSDVLPLDSLDAGDAALLRRYAVNRPELAGSRYQDALVPVYAQRSNLTNCFAPWLLAPARRKSVSPEDVDFGPEDFAAERRPRAIAHEREAYRPGLQDLSLVGAPQLRAVGELVERLRAKGARVVFLVTPEGPAFRSWYGPGRWEQSAAWLRDLAARDGVPLIDARLWTDDEGLFHDSHHMTRAGAERFSRWFGRGVLVPRLREAAQRPSDGPPPLGDAAHARPEAGRAGRNGVR